MLQILNPTDLTEQITKLYKSGLPCGTRTGWAQVDPYYTVAPGYWTVVTGIPSHGKSTWLDNLMVNLMRKGWKFIIYSPENQPPELHLSNLCEIVTGRPFRYGYNNRMDSSALAEAMDFLDANLRILRFDGGQIFPSQETFLFACQEVLLGWTEGQVGIILDPINELDHTPITGMTETQMTNWELMRYRQWIRDHGKQVHGWIVAHPAKPQKDKNGDYKDISLYDISGSSAWKNKCDFGIIIRRREDHTAVEIEKSRWRHLGKQGIAYLTFNQGNNVFSDQQTRNGSNGRFSEDED